MLRILKGILERGIRLPGHRLRYLFCKLTLVCPKCRASWRIFCPGHAMVCGCPLRKLFSCLKLGVEASKGYCRLPISYGRWQWVMLFGT